MHPGGLDGSMKASLAFDEESGLQALSSPHVSTLEACPVPKVIEVRY